MQRIAGQGNVNGMFVQENANTGQPPTVITADWMNAVQEELCTVIESVGLMLSTTDSGQLLKAINKLLAFQLSTFIGAVAYFATPLPPSGWIKANGAAISRTAYGNLFSVIGTTFGAGDGSTTFNLPDLRGEFIRGFDDNKGVDAGRVLGSPQMATAIRTLLDAYNNNTGCATPAVGMRNVDGILSGAGSENGTLGTDTNYITNVANVWSEGLYDNNAFLVRPRNIALLACIKY